MIGKVKWFQSMKGYGFIETDEGDLFFHISELEDYKPIRIDVGQELEFETEKAKDGKLKAVRLYWEVSSLS